eukprot:6561662-Prymnesium_polylepis.1
MRLTVTVPEISIALLTSPAARSRGASAASLRGATHDGKARAASSSLRAPIARLCLSRLSTQLVAADEELSLELQLASLSLDAAASPLADGGDARGTVPVLRGAAPDGARGFLEASVMCVQEGSPHFVRAAREAHSNVRRWCECNQSSLSVPPCAVVQAPRAMRLHAGRSDCDGGAACAAAACGARSDAASGAERQRRRAVIVDAAGAIGRSSIPHCLPPLKPRAPFHSTLGLPARPPLTHRLERWPQRGRWVLWRAAQALTALGDAAPDAAERAALLTEWAIDDDEPPPDGRAIVCIGLELDCVSL